MSDSDSDDVTSENLDDQFHQASAHIKTLTTNLTTSQLLEIYGLYKQATEGPCTGTRPAFYELKKREKHEAWSKLKQMPAAEAKHKYIKIVRDLDPDFTHKKTQENWVTVSTPLNTDTIIPDVEKTVFDYCKENNLPVLDKLVTKNPELLTAKDANGLALIHWAADRGNLDVLKYLRDRNADLNTRDCDGQTALHYAASCDYYACVLFLLNAGSDPLLCDDDGLRAVDLATDSSILELLKENM